MKSIPLISLVFLLLSGCAQVPSVDAPSANLQIKAVVLPPELTPITQVLPVLPKDSPAQGLAGTAKLKIELHPDGRVKFALVTEATHKVFEVPSVVAALKWRFRPGPTEGELLFVFEASPSATGSRPGSKSSAFPELSIDRASFSGEYFKIGEVDTKPRMKEARQPAYPVEKLKARQSGSAQIAFIVDESGLATQVQCLQATEEVFAQAAMDAVRKWRFVPARKGGRAVACAAQQTLSFSPD